MPRPPRPGRDSGEPPPPPPDNSLIYVDKELMLPVAARLVGTSVSAGDTEEINGGINWILAANGGYSRERSTETDVAKLFPEDLFRFAYPKIDQRRLSVREYCAAISSHHIRPPDVVSVVGRLHIKGVEVAQYDPFNPPKIDLPNQYRVYGYRTFAGGLEAEGFSVPVHFMADSAELVFYANEKPVEVVGVVKWSPTYDTGGYQLTGILLCAALLLAR